LSFLPKNIILKKEVFLGSRKMVEPQTVSQILEKLERQGYTEDFKAHKNGMRIIPKNIEIDPEQLRVDEIYRFEGEADLGDEEIIFALSCPKNNIKGTYLVAFGPMMDPIDSQIVQRLQQKFNKLNGR
jgi:hypothetical protein